MMFIKKGEKHMNELRQSNRIFIVPIVFFLVIGIIIITAILPMIKMEPNDVPIGLLVQDEGEFGENISNVLPENVPDLLDLKVYETESALNEALDNKEILGALQFPSDFSENIGSLMTDAPEQPTVTILVNEGANTMAATMMETALPNIVEAVNAQVSTQMITTISEQTESMKESMNLPLDILGENNPLNEMMDLISPIQPENVSLIANPISHEIVKVNETGDLGNSPMAFMIIVWIGSIVGGLILFLAGKDKVFGSRKEKLAFNTVQSIMPFVYGLAGGYIYTLYSMWVLDFTFESLNLVAIYIGLVMAAFTLLIFATMRWLGFYSIIIYILLMLFSLPAAQLSVHMVSPFYRDYLYSWLPIRIFVDGLREILFFSQNFINEYSVVFIWIIVISLVVVWIKNMVEKVKVQ